MHKPRIDIIPGGIGPEFASSLLAPKDVAEGATALRIVDGLQPSSSMFIKVEVNDVDPVMATYHDQGQVALKLCRLDHSVTLQGSQPIPMTEPAFGPAYDPTVQGAAEPGKMPVNDNILRDMVTKWEKGEAA